VAIGESNGLLVMGVDEVGRGPWAGPVCAGAVILPPEHGIRGLNDSKKLTPQRRRALVPEIETRAFAWGIGWASATEIDGENILNATFRAMQRAVVECLNRLGGPLAIEVSKLQPKREVRIQVDGNLLPGSRLGQEAWPWPTEAVVRGDSLIAEIAAASILAKVARDAEMQRLDGLYPGYGFARHAGYGTAEHQAALNLLGLCPEHRRSFAPVARRLQGQS